MKPTNFMCVIGLLSTIHIAKIDGIINCTSPWINVGTESCFYISTSTANYSIAKDDCYSRGGRIATFYEDELSAIVPYLGNWDYWIGLECFSFSPCTSRERWSWNDKIPAGNWTPQLWSSGEPSVGEKNAGVIIENNTIKITGHFSSLDIRYICKDDCINGKIWAPCGSRCDPSCDYPSPACIAICVARCQCPDSLLLNSETGKCQKQEDCVWSTTREHVVVTESSADNTLEKSELPTTDTQTHGEGELSTNAIHKDDELSTHDTYTEDRLLTNKTPKDVELPTNDAEKQDLLVIIGASIGTTFVVLIIAAAIAISYYLKRKYDRESNKAAHHTYVNTIGNSMSNQDTTIKPVSENSEAGGNQSEEQKYEILDTNDYERVDDLPQANTNYTGINVQDIVPQNNEYAQLETTYERIEADSITDTRVGS